MKYRLYQPDPTIATNIFPIVRRPEDVSRVSSDRYALVYEGQDHELTDITGLVDHLFGPYQKMPSDFHGAKLTTGDLLHVESETGDTQLYAYCQDDWVDGFWEKVPENISFDLTAAIDRRGYFCGVFLPVGGRAAAKWVPVNQVACAAELKVGEAFQTLVIPFINTDLICEAGALSPRSVTDANFNRALINRNMGSDAIACTLYGNAFFCKYENGEYRSLPACQCENLKEEYLLPERLHVLDGAKRVTFKYYPNTKGEA